MKHKTTIKKWIGNKLIKIGNWLTNDINEITKTIKNTPITQNNIIKQIGDIQITDNTIKKSTDNITNIQHQHIPIKGATLKIPKEITYKDGSKTQITITKTQLTTKQ
jgi:hypothetical protein